MTDTISVSLRTMLKTLATLPGGAHSSDPLLTAWSATRICTAGNRLVSEGKLFKAQLHARETRFFATTGLRDAFVASHKPPATKPGRRSRLGLMWQAVDRAPWSDDAPMGPKSADFKFTLCPSHAPRFTEQRFAFVHG